MNCISIVADKAKSFLIKLPFNVLKFVFVYEQLKSTVNFILFFGAVNISYSGNMFFLELSPSNKFSK